MSITSGEKYQAKQLVMVIDIPLEGILSCFDLSINHGETEILIGMDQDMGIWFDENSLRKKSYRELNFD